MARGDANPNSDLDLVCIWDECAPDFHGIQEKYGNVMFYSHESMLRMQKKGSLFLAHLDVDSIYLEGDRRLLSLFKGYRPPSCLTAEQSLETRKFILSIDWYPDSEKGMLWLGDVLYVALRNFVYCHNATSGVYVFGYSDALSEFGLSSEEILIMNQIRQAKYFYRDQLACQKWDFDINDFLAVSSGILSQNLSLKNGGKTRWSTDWRRDYWGGRLIERAIVNNEVSDDLFLMAIKNHNYNKRIIKNDIIRIVGDKVSEKCD